MSRWIVLAVPVQGVSDTNRDARMVAEFDGSAEDAAQALLHAAGTYAYGLRTVRRREVFKCSDGSYLIRIRGRLSTYAYVIRLAELVSDTDAPSAPGSTV
ncbi:hypothetical protein [Kitasatospora sp. NBC_01539]|uniref:hypothetical protein n=1 Tax=Kitasatospora sp. NBC_01539 TaxID=2903577 RepID=UPI0038600DB1